MMIDRSISQWALCLCLVAATSGCSLKDREGWKFSRSWDIRRAAGLKKDQLAAPQVPTRLVSTWTDTTLNRKGKTPQRGFGGRLLFFNDTSADSIRVQGQLVVYAYDDSGRQAHETQPTRRFVFPQEQFVRHESESKVGPSYSVWLPWDEVGGDQKQISLIARFEPAGGPLVVGEQTRHLLPGTRQIAAGETAPAIQPVDNIRLTQYTQASQLASPAAAAPSLSSPRPAPRQHGQVTSITLPSKTWQQRLQSDQNLQSCSGKHSTATESREPLRGSHQ